MLGTIERHMSRAGEPDLADNQLRDFTPYTGGISAEVADIGPLGPLSYMGQEGRVAYDHGGYLERRLGRMADLVRHTCRFNIYVGQYTRKDGRVVFRYACGMCGRVQEVVQ